MKITFVSNYLNHHQKYLTNELNKLDFKFIATREIGQERQSLGYKTEMNIDYLLKSYTNEKDLEIACKRIIDSDVVIIGSAPEKILKEYKKMGKLLFRYMERPLKKGKELYKYIPRLVKWHLQNRKSKNIYLLCASAFTYTDYKKFYLFDNHAYKWGYFPETIKYDIDNIIREKEKNTIIWCGRLLDWKHPLDAITLANELKLSGYDFKLKIIGTGELESEIKRLIKENRLDDNVDFLGSMSPQKVRQNMEKAGIFIFTSDKQEGWGVVLNEAMNSGCAIVASHLIGSVPYLVKHKENGMVYESENTKMLFESVKFYLDNPEYQGKHGKEAYNTIITEWNAEIAAERLYELATSIRSGKESPNLYKSGPCSKADVVNEHWFKKEDVL